MAPEFSVIIPTYNSAGFTIKAIESVVAQTHADYEIIVVDDGSTDGTNDVLRPYSGAIRYFRKANGGVSSARNAGLEKAKGTYVAFLDADDSWVPEKLEEVKKVFDADPEAGLVHSGAYLVDARGAKLGTQAPVDLAYEHYARVLMGASLITSSVVARKECFERCGYFHEGFEASAGAEDWDMWIRIARHFRFSAVDSPLVYYRVHEGNTSRKEFLKQNKDILLVLDRAFCDDAALDDALRKKAYGNAHYLRGRKYLNAIMMDKARAELMQSVKYNPVQMRSYLLILFSLLSRKNVMAIKRLYLGRRGRHEGSVSGT